MLPARPLEAMPVFTKTVNGQDASARGAFSESETLCLAVRTPRALGVSAVVLRLAPDGGEDVDLPFAFAGTAVGEDTYRLTLSLAELVAPAHHGLFYYELLFLRGKDTLFSSAAPDNVSFTLSRHSEGRFRLLVSQQNFKTPDRFKGKTMYHIFVDRFAPRGGERPAGAIYHENWHEEIEQFGAYPGAPVKNNEFFGGTLLGITDKLDYLKSLGIGVIYLSPIFKSVSNHKYDTADYETVDPQFGGEVALRTLINAAREKGIDVVLDGVFNHTGDDSRYFDKYGSYGGIGAYGSKGSPYADWFYFKNHPDSYECWWDISILPKLNLSKKGVHDYFVGKGGIVEKYTKMGVMGWRLDVADELPNAFLDELRLRVKGATDGEGVVIGEVWENAADKIAYGKRRRYFEGAQLDSVMNYPLRRSILAFVKDGNAAALAGTLRELWGSYPTEVCHCLMNVLSTHDTERILTTLGGEPDDGRYTNAELRELRLSPTARDRATALLKMAAAIQFTVFGVPSIFYGDEVGMEGYHDPFCRKPYPWGREDKALLAFYQRLGRIRAENPVFADGDFEIVKETEAALVFSRTKGNTKIIVAANKGEEPLLLRLPAGQIFELLCGKRAPREVTVLKDTVHIWRITDATSRF